jgi:acetone carboxylase gamma subunit
MVSLTNTPPKKTEPNCAEHDCDGMMLMRARVTESLFAEHGNVCCASCAHVLARVGQSWKKAAAVSSIPAAKLPGAGNNVEPRTLLRRFSCPHCGHLLDTEVALPEDPFLEDVVVSA